MLLIVALATVVVVTTSMVAQIERMAVSNTMATERARANALFALDVALDQLQTAAGPDQRVSARADILQSGNATLTQPYWTGVWKSHNPANPNNYELDVGDNALRPWSYASPTWLVSQRPPDPNESDTTFSPETFAGNITAPSPSATPDAVKMATLPAIGNSTMVVVPRVPIMDAAGENQTSTGAYAYWIQDEGIKAKVNLVPNAASNDPNNPVRYLAPATTAAELALEGNWRTAMRDLLGGNSTQLSKAKTPAMLDFVLGGNFNGADDGLAVSSPDITTHSFGVLSDTRKGGLKTDLTAAFEDFSQFEALFDRPIPGRDEATANDDGLKGKLWRVPGVVLNDNNMRDGIRWAPFWMHYNLYKSAIPPPPSGSMISGNWYAYGGYKSIGGNSTANLYTRNIRFTKSSHNYDNLAQVRPLHIGLILSYQFSTYSNPDLGPDWRGIKIYFKPQLLLANPYNVPLVSDDYDIGFVEVGAPQLKIATATQNITVNVNKTILYGYVDGDSNKNGNLDSGETWKWWDKNSDGIKNSDEQWKYVSGVNYSDFRTDKSSRNFNSGEVKVFSYQGPKTGSNEPVYAHTLKRDPNNDAHDFTLRPLSDSSMPKASVFDMSKFYIECDDKYSQYDEAKTFFNKLNVNDVITIEPLSYLSGLNAIGGHAFFKTKFTSISGPSSITGAIDQFDTPRPLWTLVYRNKGRKPVSDPKVPLFSSAGSIYNPLLPKSSYFWDSSARSFHSVNEVFDFQRYTDSSSAWGASDAGILAAGLGTDQTILKEIPTEPMVSVGQFKNANLYTWTRGLDNTDRYLGALFAVGNSWPDPEIASQTSPDQERLSFSITGAGAGLIAVDDVFLNNEALFDKFFFSTVPPNNRANNTTYPVAWGNSTANFSQSNVDAGDPLLNPRLKYVKQVNGSAPDYEGLDGFADLRDMDTAAANLLVDGSFNVNSTSVSAWKAILGSLRFSQAPSPAYPIPSMVSLLSTNNSTAVIDDFSKGIRVLDDQQLSDLAEAIVNQIKLRGPFLNLSDFVNRRRASGTLGAKGAIQAAIDDSQINTLAYGQLGVATNLTDPSTGSDIAFSVYHENAASKGLNRDYVSGVTPAIPANTAEGAAGVITQADLLQPLAPFLTARSDTFAIRVFGEAGSTLLNGGYRVEGEAYGEAIVQRMPEYVDQTDSALTDENPTLGKEAGNATPVDAVNAVNQKLGRRFKVVSFRWLNPEEI